MNIKRSGLRAFILTIFAPGLGQIYKAQALKYFVVLALCALFYSVGIFSGLFETPLGGLLIFALILFGGVWLLFDASRTRYIQELRWYNRWYYYFAFILLGYWFGTSGVWPLIHYFRANYYECFNVPSGSSEPTILRGDSVLASRLYYRNHPISRGDLVVLRRPDDPATPIDENTIQILKRVIGLPGETVEIRGSHVLINGNELTESYASWSNGGAEYGNFGPKEVSENAYFLLGDNRDQSKDSRFWNEPFIPKANIESKIMYIYFSSTDYARIGKVIE